MITKLAKNLDLQPFDGPVDNASLVYNGVDTAQFDRRALTKRLNEIERRKDEAKNKKIIDYRVPISGAIGGALGYAASPIFGAKGKMRLVEAGVEAAGMASLSALGNYYQRGKALKEVSRDMNVLNSDINRSIALNNTLRG